MSLTNEIRRRIKKTFVWDKKQGRHSLVGPAKNWKMKRDFQINFLGKNGLARENTLLDIGCGTLRGGIPLIEFLDVANYAGLESRSEVLEEGIKELKESNLETKKPNLLLIEDVAKLTNQKFDFIWSFSVLIHMSDEILDQTLKIVRDHLSDSGVFFANVNIGTQSNKEWQGFPVVWRSLSFYEERCAQHGLDVKEIGTLHSLGHISGVKSQDQQKMLKITIKS